MPKEMTAMQQYRNELISIAKDLENAIPGTDQYGYRAAIKKVITDLSSIAAKQFASQPPAGKYWEEVDAVKEPPGGDDQYFTMVIDEDHPDVPFKDSDAFINGEWNIDGGYRVISYLRPVTGQRYSEAIEIVKELAEWSEKYPRQPVYPVSADVDGKLMVIEEKSKQFIQSLKK